VQLFERHMAETRADMSYVAPRLIFSYRKDKRPEEGPRASRRSKSDDDNVLAFRSLYLQPIVTAGARYVRTISSFGHDALKAAPFRLFKKFASERRAA
jgi:hypothetical protein